MIDRSVIRLVGLGLLFLGTRGLAAEPSAPGKPFVIKVSDDQTGRGVPLVELQTVNNIRCWTDSNGIVAFHEPGLMKQRVFFHVKSHGYEFPKDGFGFRGKALDVTEGGSAELKIRRINVAERLYRLTGAGIYADSVRVGLPVPLRRPVLNGLVFGSDSVVNAEYRGRIIWFWGDTNRPAYPLGNFQVPGATSRLPGKDGLDPESGVDLEYWVDEKGFARQTAPLPGPGPTWINGLVVLKDRSGKERLFACYVKVRGFLEVYERGLVEWNDAKEVFEKVTTFPLEAPLHPGGHPFVQKEGGQEYVYFANPYPWARVCADPESLRDLSRYEGYTCLQAGTRLEGLNLDRDRDGRLVFGWKRNTPPLSLKEQTQLVRSGKMKPAEGLIHLRDAGTGKPVAAHGGSVYRNRYRDRWVMIAVESGGTSLLGEVWYAEADTPLGPWVYARKVVTHDRYSFYNPKQHPLFDKADGRVIFFEGTYTHTFSGNSEQTPRYDYNQIMYKLDLADPRLVLPVPIYLLSDPAQPCRFGTRAALPPKQASRPIAFYALDRARPGSVPVHASVGEGGALHVGQPSAGVVGQPVPVFHALPAETKDLPAATVPLYEFVHEDGRKRAYLTDGSATLPGYRRGKEPICHVWPNPGRPAAPR